MSRPRRRATAAARAQHLLTLRHGVAPYDPEPANRRQRRQIEREQRRTDKKLAMKGGSRG
jgi:hypothetical protein